MTEEEFQEIERCYRALLMKLPSTFNIADWEPLKKYEQAKWRRYQTMMTEEPYSKLFDK